MSFIGNLFGPPNIEKLKAKQNIKGLTKALQYKDLNICIEAAKALGEIGDNRAVNALSDAIENGDATKYFAVLCAEALAKIGDTGIDALIALLNDDNRHVRHLAIINLRDSGDARAVEPLVETLQDKHRGISEDAAKALDEIGWKPSNDENAAWYYIATYELEKCAKLGSVAVDPLIEDTFRHRDGSIGNAVECLGEIGDERAVEPLIRLLNDNNHFNRKSVVTALGKIGDVRAVEPLTRKLGDKHWEVCQAAATSLAEIGDARAVKPLIEALNDYIRKDRCLRNIAKALFDFYSFEQTPETIKQEILAERDVIENRIRKSFITGD